MAFRNSSTLFGLEHAERRAMKGRLLWFGMSFVDDSLLGIRPDDLILVGAPPGVGKTQFCVNLAITNLFAGKKVHFFALEAGEFEIEQRFKFQVIAESFYGDPDRPRLGRPLMFDEWEAGLLDDALDKYENTAEEYSKTALNKLCTFYKADSFDVSTLIENVTFISQETDLIVIDHAHFFDWDDSNDNRALKEIAKTSRDLCRGYGKPIILVAHLRKRDKKDTELVAGLDEFHGSSDLVKIATKVITIARGGPAEEGGQVTYVRTPKNRHSGASASFLARMIFNEKKGSYEQEYKVGWANAQKFGEIERTKLPSWIGRSRLFRGGANNNFDPSRTEGSDEGRGRPRNFALLHGQDQGIPF